MSAEILERNLKRWFDREMYLGKLHFNIACRLRELKDKESFELNMSISRHHYKMARSIRGDENNE